jgi:hypothetical protein
LCSRRRLATLTLHFPSIPWLSRKRSCTMALDAEHRSSIYHKFLPLLGDDDANA